MQGKTIKIFGKTYPLYRNTNGTYDENSVAFRDWLPSFFINQEHFSPEAYYSALVKKFPQFKKKWYDIKKLPSERDIENYFIEHLGYAAMDGANSVPLVEKKYGIKIGGNYKYPKGMSDIEYHAYEFNIFGFSPVWYQNINTKQGAYMRIWQDMHYSQESEISDLQALVQELIDLNPELKKLKFDKNKRYDLIRIKAGVTYNFPVADIQLFLNGVDKEYKEKMKTKMKSLGLDPKDFQWVLSFETIENVAQKIKAAKTIAPLEQNNTNATDQQSDTTKERKTSIFLRGIYNVKKKFTQKFININPVRRDDR